MPRRPRSDVVFIGSVLGSAAALRIWTALSLRHDPRIAEPVIDGLAYLETARAMANGSFDWNQIFFQSPLYPLVLAGTFRVAPPVVFSIQVTQMLLGLGVGALLYLAVQRWAGKAAARVSMILWLFYGPILEMENEVVPATLFLLFSTAALWLWPERASSVEAARRAPPSAAPWSSRGPSISVWRSWGFGIIAGLLIVGRGTFVLLPMLALAEALRTQARSSPRNGRSWWWILAGIVLCMTPLAIHQTRTAGALMLLTPNSGLNLYIGNNPAARGIYSNPPGLDIEQDFSGRRSAERLAGRTMSVQESSALWRRQALGFLQEQPARAAWLLGRKMLLFFSPREIPQIENFSRVAADTPSLRLAFLRFGWLLPLAAWGVVASRGRRSSPRAGPGAPSRLFPFLALIAAGVVATVLFFAAGRYRIPIIPGFLGLAGIGLVDLWHSRRQRGRLAAAILILLAFCLVQPVLPSYPVARANANADYLLGLRLARRGDHAPAIRIFSRALEHDPRLAEAWHGMGVSHSQLRAFEDAVRDYQRALELAPGSTWTEYNLGLCLEALGRDEEAARALARAVALEPRHADLRCQLGTVLIRLGRTAEAAQHLRAALEIDPGSVRAAQALAGLRR